MEVNKEKIRYILQFFFDKGENGSQVAEIVKGAYGADTVTANCVQFWFRRFHSGIFDVKDAPRTDRPVVENVDKITEIIEVDRHVSSRSIAQELKTDHKTALNHLRKIQLKKKLDFALFRIDYLHHISNTEPPKQKRQSGHSSPVRRTSIPAN
ncbi:histone-lysine N-methyltransferase SETMAR [Trichonephila clavipes]|nr:histone-lysine N-methyltransferase SETMAR [Trichonephila clavipes]